MTRWLLLSLVIVIADQVSKYLAEAYLTLHQPIAILPSFNLTLAYNTGAAFSFLAGSGGWQRWFFVVLAIIIVAVVVTWLRRLAPEQRWQAAAFALVVGGAVGNVLDRALQGHVIDFVDLYHPALGGWPGFSQGGHWPVFNVADIAICVGAVILVADLLFGSADKRSDQPG